VARLCGRSWVARQVLAVARKGEISPRRARKFDVICASISTFEVLKMASESHFFLHEAPQNAFYKPEGGGLGVSSARSNALESMLLDT